MSIPRERILSENRHSVDLTNGKAEGLPRLTLHMVSTLSVQVHNEDVSSGFARRSYKTSEEDPPTRNSGADAAASLPSDDSSRKPARIENAMAMSGSLGIGFGSEELDRRLQTIGEALCQRESKTGRRRGKLYTSEVSRTEDSQNTYDGRTKSQVHAEKIGNLGIWRTSQDVNLSKRSGLSPGATTKPCSLLGSPSKVSRFLMPYRHPLPSVYLLDTYH